MPSGQCCIASAPLTADLQWPVSLSTETQETLSQFLQDMVSLFGCYWSKVGKEDILADDDDGL